MPLLEEMEASGKKLFRWRSYIPLFFLVVLVSGLPYFQYPLGSHFLDQAWKVICLCVSFTGLAVRAMTIGATPNRTSGRNTKEQVADRLNTTGMYSIIRNPLYLGNFLMVLGVMISIRVWWVLLIYILFFTLYYERIIFAEEMYLRRKFGSEYMNWASKTPAFVPRFSQWKAPEVLFSWKKVLRREYHGVLAVVLAQFSIEVAGSYRVEGVFKFDLWWICLVSLTIVAYIVIRFLHKKTRILKSG
jgi:protein-S-isoprenylcysteine O-methyltransferase Ste14